MVHTPHRRVILDMDSSESPVTVSRREPPTTATSSVFAITLSFCSTSSGIAKQRRRPGNVHSADDWQELLEPVVKGSEEGTAAFVSG